MLHPYSLRNYMNLKVIGLNSLLNDFIAVKLIQTGIKPNQQKQV